MVRAGAFVVVVVVVVLVVCAFLVGRETDKHSTQPPASPRTTATCGALGYYREADAPVNEPGYNVTVMNRSGGVIGVTGFIVTFTNGATETGSDRESVTPVYLQPHQSYSWMPTPQSGPWVGAQFSGRIDVRGTCQVVSVATAPASAGT